jgi:Tfp pilus assembly protein PilW
MVGMALGLVVVGIVVNILMSNLQTYRVNEDMGLQESARTSFELMAGMCAKPGRTAAAPAPGQCDPQRRRCPRLGGHGRWQCKATRATRTRPAWWTPGHRPVSARTDAVLVIRAAPSGVIVTAHNPTGTVFTVSSPPASRRIPWSCDASSAAVFQVGRGHRCQDLELQRHRCADELHRAGLSRLSIPASCGGFANKTFTAGGFMAKLASALWYIGNNADGGHSLYRTQLSNSGASRSRPRRSPDVEDLQVKYLTADVSGATPVLAPEWVDADSITDWSPSATQVVVSARLDLTLHSRNKVSTDATALERHLISVVGLRNRETR